MIKKKELSAKEQRFVDEYLISQNKTKAAIRAGYSGKSAARVGYGLSIKVHIREAIDKGLVAAAERNELDNDTIIRKLVAISKTRFGDVATFDGTTVTYKPIEQWPDHAQESVWISQDFAGVRLHQPKKLEALIQLAKICGLTSDFNTALACLRTHGIHVFQDQDGQWILEDKQSSNSTP